MLPIRHHIALFSDSQMLPGLHVTLVSLAEASQGISGIIVHIFLDRISNRDKKLLRDTLSMCNAEFHYELRDYSPQGLSGAKALHGNLTTYGRIFLSKLLPDVDRCLYLDSDLVVNVKLLDILNEFNNDYTLFADGDGIRKNALEAGLFQTAGLIMDGCCFNAGVLGMNLHRWRIKDGDRLCAEAAAKYGGMLLSADQALLNVVFHDDFKAIGCRFNRHIYPDTKVVEKDQSSIYHFVGSPKPWDYFGSKVHNNFALWKSYYRSTALAGISPWRYVTIKRTLLISRSIYKTWKATC